MPGKNSLLMPSRLTALWHYLKFLPRVYPVTNALTIGIYYYNKCITNCFNNFFINVGPDLAKTITPPNKIVGIYDIMGPSKLNSMYLNEVTETELVKGLSTCNHKHSCDVNDLNMYVVKSTFMFIIQPFKYICNLSFNTGVFPSVMKIAKIVPQFLN